MVVGVLSLVGPTSTTTSSPNGRALPLTAVTSRFLTLILCGAYCALHNELVALLWIRLLQGAGHFYFSTDFYHDLLQSGSFH